MDGWKQWKCDDAVQFNAGAEGAFCRLLRVWIGEGGGCVAVAFVLQNAAYKLDVSPVTVKRYLLKYTAEGAPFTINGKGVELRVAGDGDGGAGRGDGEGPRRGGGDEGGGDGGVGVQREEDKRAGAGAVGGQAGVLPALAVLDGGLRGGWLVGLAGVAGDGVAVVPLWAGLCADSDGFFVAPSIFTRFGAVSGSSSGTPGSQDEATGIAPGGHHEATGIAPGGHHEATGIAPGGQSDGEGGAVGDVEAVRPVRWLEGGGSGVEDAPLAVGFTWKELGKLRFVRVLRAGCRGAAAKAWRAFARGRSP